MDDHNRRRRQNDPPMHTTSSSAYQQSLQDASQQRRAYAGSTSERYRSSHGAGTSPPSAARGLTGGSTGYSGYYQEPTATAFSAAAIPQATAMGYHQSADYGQERQTQQSFASTYNPLMYNVQQAGSQAPVYDTSQQFSSRQPAALQMMTTDVAAPYFSSEPANSAAAPTLQSQTASAAAASASTGGVYQQSAADRATLLQGYSTASGMADVGGGIGAPQASAAAAASADVTMEDQDYAASSGLDEAYAAYQAALREVFQNIQNGVLAAASESLLNLSDWLLSHVTELGLTTDDQDLHEQRISLWNDFNHAWLSIFQRQKDMMQSGQQIQRPQTLISQEDLEKMGKELLRLDDHIERHGLVDYQYGVMEDAIIAILEECLDLYERPGGPGGSTATSSSRQ